MALGFGLFVGVAIGPGVGGHARRPAPADRRNPPLPAGVDEGGGGSGEDERRSRPLRREAPEPEAAPPEPESLRRSRSKPRRSNRCLSNRCRPSRANEPAAKPPALKKKKSPKARSLEGTVVHANPAAGSYALAIDAAANWSPSTPAKLPAAGTKLSVPVEQLANGTFAEEEKPARRQGKATQASFAGIVTFVDPDPAAPAYTVSGRGASVLVRIAPDPSGAAPALPPLGAFATVTVEIGKPPVAPDPATAPPPPACDLNGALPVEATKAPPAALWQEKLRVEHVEPSTYLEVSGVIAGLCADRPALLLSADDAGDGGKDLLLALSPKVDARKLRAGDSILAAIEIAEDGALTLTGLVSDERAKGAGDATTAQGDLKR